ncbi:BAQ_1a_G0005020.mRNA.1.CDS.1 [Saccharomyces cerevisiae]|nr:BAQ_1a_G0005020.mRNA.1.CDS.1 [Saccharomyces cerevisiae]CAI7053035.1 BAQ_1a_G0005020.mRNA.1.CDS.1 [Saccharomyces cerevisiae]
MKWMPFSNSKVSVPKIAQHCCPFSITRLLSHCMNARASAAFFFCYIKAKSQKLLF